MDQHEPPHVTRIVRRSRVLVPSALACLSTLPTINLTSGCLHGCAYCYAASYAGHPGPGRAALYDDTADRLERELRRASDPPRAVYFSPSSDLFQPDPAIAGMAERVLAILFRHRVGVAFLSKGAIPEPAMRLFEDHAALVQAQIGLLSLDDRVAQTFESGAAPPATRLAQMRRLVAAGIPTAVRVDPVLPGITDGEDTFTPLLDGVAAAGVRAASIGILFVRPGIRATLRRASGPLAPRVPALLARFRRDDHLAMRGAGTSVGVLPAAERAAILDRFHRLAVARGIAVRVCACKNPDVASGSCNIAGTWRARQERQLALPDPRATHLPR